MNNIKNMIILMVGSFLLASCAGNDLEDDSANRLWTRTPFSSEQMEELKARAHAGDTEAISALFIEYSIIENGGTNELYWLKRGAELGHEDLVFIEDRVKKAAEKCGLDWNDVDRITPEIRDNIYFGEEKN